MDERFLQLSQVLLRVFNKFARNEKQPRRFGIDDLLHPSEIHMIALIGDNPQTHSAELARISGVTRGAVSQSLAKLEKKGLVEKVADPQNDLKKVLVLTDQGRIAYRTHERYHEEMDADLYNYVQALSDAELKVIERFFRELENMADRRN